MMYIWGLLVDSQGRRYELEGAPPLSQDIVSIGDESANWFVLLDSGATVEVTTVWEARMLVSQGPRRSVEEMARLVKKHGKYYECSLPIEGSPESGPYSITLKGYKWGRLCLWLSAAGETWLYIKDRNHWWKVKEDFDAEEAVSG